MVQMHHHLLVVLVLFLPLHTTPSPHFLTMNAAPGLYYEENVEDIQDMNNDAAADEYQVWSRLLALTQGPSYIINQAQLVTQYFEEPPTLST